jgi:hypothetical protein
MKSKLAKGKKEEEYKWGELNFKPGQMIPVDGDIKDYALWNTKLADEDIKKLAMGVDMADKISTDSSSWNHYATTTDATTSSMWVNGENKLNIDQHKTYCADCYSKDYTTKTVAEFTAEGFSVCEEHFKRYCEMKKDKYRSMGTWNGR